MAAAKENCQLYTEVLVGTQTVDDDSFSIRPVTLSITFSGQLPRHLARPHVPIQILVCLSDEHHPFITPTIHAIPPSLTTPSEIFNQLEFLSAKSTDDSCDCGPYSDAQVPFLPLPAEFDMSSSRHWTRLSRAIELWLVSQVSTRSHLWSWGRDAFWLAFIAAHPSFPGGKWRMWDVRIPLQGPFIESWLSGTSSMDYTEDQVELRRQLWSDFSRHVELFQLPLLP